MADHNAPTPLDPTEFLTRLFESGQQMWAPFMGVVPANGSVSSQGDPPEPANAAVMNPMPALGAVGAVADPFAAYGVATRALVGMQQDYVRQMTDMWLSMAGMGGATSTGGRAEDRRFATDAWRNDPRYKALTDGYLAYSKFMQDSVEAATLDAKAKDQMRFAVKQYIDAMSPSNFLASNPEAIQLALETGGASVVEGMNLFAKDMAKGRISMTDETAFEVGKNVGVTPGSVVYRNALIELIQYAPQTPQVHARPLVIIPPCINKYYILDLTPENSFVRHAVAEGNTVFLVSWRNIAPAQGTMTWDDYLQMGVMEAIDLACDIAGVDKVNTLGFCIGGTLLSSALAVMRANGEDKVESVTLLTTMLDFSMPGEIGALLTPESVAQRESSIGALDVGGVLEGKDLALAFSALRANDLIWPYVVNSYLKGKAPPAFDLLYWNSDGTNLPGPMFCFYIRNMYLENNLREPGKTTQCGVAVDLGEIDMPAFIYASREDHIVPWKSAFESTKLLGGDISFVLGASGHIAGVVNPPAKKKRNYWKNERLVDDPEAWLDAADNEPGSWWPKWSAWLAERAGPLVAAPKKAGNRRHKIIEPAPGAYVLQKA